MKALVYEGPRQLNVLEVERPEPAPGEVLVRVRRVGICGSELAGYLGHNSLRKPPLVMGHEFAGTVAALGDGVVSDLEVGERVTANPLVSCGRCARCRVGEGHLCAERRLIGAHRPGAFAEFVAAPATNVHPLPEGLSLDAAATTEPLACAVHACRLLRISPSDRVLVVGAGPIGLLALQTAKTFGVREVVVLDLDEERLEVARSLGAITVVAPEELDAAMPAGGFDAAVEAVGADATRRQCVGSVRAGGKVALVGLHAEESPLPVNLAVRNELTLQGCFGYSPDDFVLALRWLDEGRATLEPWAERFPLAEGRSCFERLLAGSGGVAKILLEA
jgi:2-desacetyl-2-hydroxyethyl bacteriochlorophyllide A dehydrogenase